MLAVRFALAVVAATGIFFAGETITSLGSPMPVAQEAPSGVTVAGAEAFIGELIKSLGPVGFIVWFAYHTVSKTLPEKDRQIERIAAEHRAAVHELTEAVTGMVEHCKARAQP